MKILIGLIACCLIAGLMIACDDDSQDKPTYTPTRGHIPSDDEIDWVGTSAIYADTGGHDLSMVVFSTSWCGYCRQLEQWTLTDSEVVEIVGESFNAVHVHADYDSTVMIGDQEIASAAYSGLVFSVRAYPTIVVVSRGGNEVTRNLGYMPWDSFAEFLRSARGF